MKNIKLGDTNIELGKITIIINKNNELSIAREIGDIANIYNCISFINHPELNLHPENQVRITDALSSTAKRSESPKLIITTNSSFILEGLDKYSVKYKLDTKVYLNDNGNIEDLTNDMSRAFEKITGNAYKMLDEILGDDILDGYIRS